MFAIVVSTSPTGNVAPGFFFQQSDSRFIAQRSIVIAIAIPIAAVFREAAIFTTLLQLLQVEDCKDSVWLVKVVSGSTSTVISDRLWRRLKSRLTQFGVRFGTYDCRVDRRLVKTGFLSKNL